MVIKDFWDDAEYYHKGIIVILISIFLLVITTFYDNNFFFGFLLFLLNPLLVILDILRLVLTIAFSLGEITYKIIQSLFIIWYWIIISYIFHRILNSEMTKAKQYFFIAFILVIPYLLVLTIFFILGVGLF